MRSRCHQRPLNRQASVGADWGWETTLGRGHNASIAAAIAAASSSLGAGVIEAAATSRPYRAGVRKFRPRMYPEASSGLSGSGGFERCQHTARRRQAGAIRAGSRQPERASQWLDVLEQPIHTASRSGVMFRTQ